MRRCYRGKLTAKFTNKDNDRQGSPTSNRVVDGSNYSDTIHSIVTQSVHEEEEGHPLYSGNPLTYQGDYTEISVALLKHRNIDLLSGYTFDWTTSYNLKHDEYGEIEQATFSYPAKILPPSTQSIAKSIIINTDLKAELNYKDILQILTPISSINDNTEEGYSSSSSISKNIDIDIRKGLHPAYY